MDATSANTSDRTTVAATGAASVLLIVVTSFSGGRSAPSETG